jgi:hypothetical protein
MKAKIHTISEEDDFKLIAIATHLNDYKISWLLNEEMNCKFQQSNDLLITDQINNRTNKFGVYIYENGTDSIFTLYSNHTENEILLKSIKNIDYILKYQGQLSNNQFKQFIDKMKKLKNILTVIEIDKSKLKPKEIELFI